MIQRAPIPKSMLQDITEPNAVNKVLELEETTWNVMSQSSQTLATQIGKDRLHCLVGGYGSRVTLVNAFQRVGMKVGDKKQLQVPDMEEGLVEVSLPNEYSFVDMNHQYPPQEDWAFIKPFHVDLEPGDCVYIPGYWWH